MKIRKYKKLRRKWVMGQKMTQKEVADLQSVYPEPEWKKMISDMANPEYTSAWSPRGLRYGMISNWGIKRLLAKMTDKYFDAWLTEQKDKGWISDSWKNAKWENAEMPEIKL